MKLRSLVLALSMLVSVVTTTVAPVVAEAARIDAVDERALETEIAKRITRIPEFAWMRKEAERRGLRIWLFGGTAAGYAHYVAWDMKREAGDERYQPDRFDYDYTNVFRSTQDLDVIVDGSPEETAKFQGALRDRYKYVEGSLSVWEVRSLRHQIGEPGRPGFKEPLLGSRDMIHQHTDSNSIGLIEVTRSKDRVVRDLMEWNKGEAPRFLSDVANGRLHYYFSNQHETTSRARIGENPAILSVIRALTKAFQYELSFTHEDLAVLKRIVAEFDPRTVPRAANSKIEKSGKKLVQHAVNIEYAMTLLDGLGLRSKLVSMNSNASSKESMAWWLSKEPLRSRPLGVAGRTAREMGIDVVAHETSSFIAYESITRAHTGDANVLISRDGAAGEAARHGDGFYTRKGLEGARDTGLTIRFRMDPNAREGVDFTVPALANDYVVIKNRNAIRVIPESLKMSLVEYFEFLKTSSLEASDKGILEKFRRRLGRMIADATPDEFSKVISIVREASDATDGRGLLVAKEWFQLEASLKYPDIFERLLDSVSRIDAAEREAALGELLKVLLEAPHWKKVFDSNSNPRLTAKVNELVRPGVREWIAERLAHGQWQTFFQFDSSPAAGKSGWMKTAAGVAMADEIRVSATMQGTYESFLWQLLEEKPWHDGARELFEVAIATMEKDAKEKGFADPQATRGLSRLLRQEVWLRDPKAMELFEKLHSFSHQSNSVSQHFFEFLPPEAYPLVVRQAERTLELFETRKRPGEFYYFMSNFIAKDEAKKLPQWEALAERALAYARKYPETMYGKLDELTKEVEARKKKRPVKAVSCEALF